jgi:hypothetical protein
MARKWKVNIAIERVTETLDKRDSAALRMSQSQKLSRAAPQVAQYRSDEYV